MPDEVKQSVEDSRCKCYALAAAQQYAFAGIKAEVVELVDMRLRIAHGFIQNFQNFFQDILKIFSVS